MTVTTLTLPKMYPAQRRVIMDPARIVVIEAATKAGKTAGCLMWLLAKAWNDKKAGGSYWWVAPVYQQSKMAMDRVKKWLIQADPHKSHWSSHDTDLWIMLPSGCKIWFRSADDPDNLYGEDVRGACMDEATRTKEEAFFAVRSTLTATRGQLRIIGNVRGRKNWVHQMAQRADGVDIAYHKLTAWDAVEGGILDREEIESAKRDLPEHVFRELYLAEVADDGGNPFGIPAIGRCDADSIVVMWTSNSKIGTKAKITTWGNQFAIRDMIKTASDDYCIERINAIKLKIDKKPKPKDEP